MATQIKPLVNTKFLENSLTDQYTATNVTAVIDKATASNNSGGILILTIHLVNSGGSADSSNVMITRSILDGQSYLCAEIVGHVLSNGQKIVAMCDTASALVFRISGREVTS